MDEVDPQKATMICQVITWVRTMDVEEEDQLADSLEEMTMVG